MVEPWQRIASKILSQLRKALRKAHPGLYYSFPEYHNPEIGVYVCKGLKHHLTSIRIGDGGSIEALVYKRYPGEHHSWGQATWEPISSLAEEDWLNKTVTKLLEVPRWKNIR